MNAVGRFGELIVEHQLGIEIGLLVLLGILVLAFIILLIRRAVRRKAVLAEIEERVQDISEAMDEIAGSVSGLSFAMIGLEEKQEEINKCLSAGNMNGDGDIRNIKEPTQRKALDAGEETTSGETAEGEQPQDEQPQDEPAVSWLRDPLNDDDRGEEEIAKSNPSLRYYSRDWGTDKHGNVYTEEMLKSQIG